MDLKFLGYTFFSRASNPNPGFQKLALGVSVTEQCQIQKTTAEHHEFLANLPFCYKHILKTDADELKTYQSIFHHSEPCDASMMGSVEKLYLKLDKDKAPKAQNVAEFLSKITMYHTSRNTLVCDYDQISGPIESRLGLDHEFFTNKFGKNVSLNHQWVLADADGPFCSATGFNSKPVSINTTNMIAFILSSSGCDKLDTYLYGLNEYIKHYTGGKTKSTSIYEGLPNKIEEKTDEKTNMILGPSCF